MQETDLSIKVSGFGQAKGTCGLFRLTDLITGLGGRTFNMTRNQKGFSGVLAVLLVTVGIGFIIFAGVNAWNNWANSTRATVTITVKDKERVNSNETESKYLVFTEEGEVFENTDSYYFGKYDSSDLYGQLEIGKKYKCDSFGERNPRWSWYRNLLSCEAV